MTIPAASEKSYSFSDHGNRSVDIVAADALHTQPARFEAEVALEDAGVALADFEQGIDHLIRDVVCQVAGGDWAG